MSDVPGTPVQTELPVPQPVAAEPAPAVAPVPSVAVEPVAAPTEVPAASEPVAAAETPLEPAQPALKPHTDEPGLLTAEVPEKKPATEAPATEATPTEPPLVEAKPEPLAYEPFTLPDGVEPGEQLSRYTEIVGEHRLPQEAAQQLIDLHIAEVQRLQEQSLAEQHRVFGETRRAWRQQIMADEELGGSGFDTNRAAAQRMLNLFVPENRREAFNEMLVLTGVSDHPEFFRYLVSMARKFDEPVPTPQPRNPPPDIARNPASGRRLNYNHPSSRQMNGSAG